nr:MAG TPA: hypothetical protein [Caudoviricetes sp.]
MTVDIKGLGKITASKEVLSEIVSAFYNEGEFYKNKNYLVRSECSNKRADTIYDALEKCGYYDKNVSR